MILVKLNFGAHVLNFWLQLVSGILAAGLLYLKTVC